MEEVEKGDYGIRSREKSRAKERRRGGGAEERTLATCQLLEISKFENLDDMIYYWVSFFLGLWDRKDNLFFLKKRLKKKSERILVHGGVGCFKLDFVCVGRAVDLTWLTGTIFLSARGEGGGGVASRILLISNINSRQP